MSSVVLGTMPSPLHSCVEDQITHVHVPVCQGEADASLTRMMGCLRRIACFNWPMGAYWLIVCHKGCSQLCGGVLSHCIKVESGCGIGSG